VCESKLIGTTAALLPIIPPSPDLLKFILTGDLSEYEKRRALRKARDARRAAEPLKRNRSGTGRDRCLADVGRSLGDA
jgi:hypothetical protein